MFLFESGLCYNVLIMLRILAYGFLLLFFLLESSIDCIRHAKAIHWSFQTEEVMENKRSQLVML